MTPERVLAHMRERLAAVANTRNPRRRAMIPIDDLYAYADALARTIDERDQYARLVPRHGGTVPSASPGPPPRFMLRGGGA